MRALLTQIFIYLALAYVGVAALLFLFQDRLAYYPEIGRDITSTPREHGMDYEPMTLATPDGERLDAWFVPAPQSQGIVLFLHGNAGNISHRMDSIAMLHRLGYAVLIFDYRGYGRSSGTPSEVGLHLDAESAWTYLTETRRIPREKIVLFGESLGGALAAHLAATQRPGALVLASTFTSVPDLAADLYPWLPARWLARLRYDTHAALKQATCPVLIAHSPDDEIVPYRHAQTLFDAAAQPKTYLPLAGGHNDGFIFMRDDWVETLADFLHRHVSS